MAEARGSAGGFAQVIANTAAAVTGLSAADFTNMAISGASVDRALSSGSAEVVVTYDVMTTPKEAGADTLQGTYDAVGGNLQDAVSSGAFAQVRREGDMRVRVGVRDRVRVRVRVRLARALVCLF